MTRTKVSVKRRQQRSRREREAIRAQLREARVAEQQQDEEEEEVAPQQSAENQEEQAEREEDKALVEEPIRENARDAEKEERHRALAEQPIKAQEDNAREQGGGEEEGHEERKGQGGEEEEEGHEERKGRAGEEGEEEEEEESNGDDDEGQLLLTDYEKQRERRLKENAAKLAALNLPALASSFGSPTRSHRQSSKKKSKKDDDYMPSSCSDSEDSDSDVNNEEGAGLLSQQDVDGDYNEDQALQEAIALSLNATADNVIGTRSKGSQTRKGKRQVPDTIGGAKKRRKGRREQFTSDEIAAIFSIIDEQGNGKFSAAEVERIARAHDFTWSKQEISDMIDIFDSNKDGQLDLSEFQGIFGHMNMLKMHVT